jgi:hypothetical protein
VAVDPEVVELLLERLGVGLELLPRALERRGGRRGQQADRGELERLRTALPEVERLLPGEALLGEARLGLGRLLHDEAWRQLRLDRGEAARRRGGNGRRPRKRRALTPAFPILWLA